MEDLYSGMQGGEQRTDPRSRPERADASQPFQLPSSSQPENGHPASSTTLAPSMTTRSFDGGTFKPFGPAQAKGSPARNEFIRPQLFVPPPSAHDRSPSTLPSMSTLSVQQRPHPIRRPLTNGAVYGSKGGAAIARTDDPFANSLNASGSTSRFAEPTMAEQPLALSAQAYSHATPFANRCGSDSRAFSWTSSFAPFTQLATAPSRFAAPRSTQSYSRATAMTASFGGIKVDVKASESSHEDEVILATRSKTVPTTARGIRRTGEFTVAPQPLIASPKQAFPDSAKPAGASSASPTRTAPRSSDRTRPRSAASTASTSSSIASAAPDSRSTSPRRVGESRTTFSQAAVDGFMRWSPTEKAPPGPVSSNNDGEHDRAAPKRLVRQADFELDIPDFPLAAIRNGARTVSTPLGEPSTRNASFEMVGGSGVYASKRQKRAPPLVAREGPPNSRSSDPRRTLSSRSPREPAATQETFSDRSALQSQRKGKGEGTSPDPPAAASMTSGRHVVPDRSTPNRMHAAHGPGSPLTSMDESSDVDHQSTSRGRMLPRSRSAPRTSNASISYVEPNEDEFDDVLPGKKAEAATAAESDAFDSDPDVEGGMSSDDVWTPAAGAGSSRSRKRPRTLKSAARSSKSTARSTTAEPVSARTVSAVATNGGGSDNVGIAATHGVTEGLLTSPPQLASTAPAALTTSRPTRRSRTTPSADGTPRAWTPAVATVTRINKDATVMQPMQDVVPDGLPVAGPSGMGKDAKMAEARAGKSASLVRLSPEHAADRTSSWKRQIRLRASAKVLRGVCPVFKQLVAARSPFRSKMSRMHQETKRLCLLLQGRQVVPSRRAGAPVAIPRFPRLVRAR